MHFERALHHLSRVILEANPCVGPVYMCKIDIADGFYRVWILPADIPRLGMMIPTKYGEEPLIGFPLALPIDWVNSPSYLYHSETSQAIADMTTIVFFYLIRPGETEPPVTAHHSASVTCNYGLATRQ
jgi:hypothetical protein